jgi:hypothetical protein
MCLQSIHSQTANLLNDLSHGKMNINLLDEIPKRLILWDYVCLTNLTYVIPTQRYK